MSLSPSEADELLRLRTKVIFTQVEPSDGFLLAAEGLEEELIEAARALTHDNSQALVELTGLLDAYVDAARTYVGTPNAQTRLDYNGAKAELAAHILGAVGPVTNPGTSYRNKDVVRLPLRTQDIGQLP